MNVSGMSASTAFPLRRSHSYLQKLAGKPFMFLLYTSCQHPAFVMCILSTKLVSICLPNLSRFPSKDYFNCSNSCRSLFFFGPALIRFFVSLSSSESSSVVSLCFSSISLLYFVVSSSLIFSCSLATASRFSLLNVASPCVAGSVTLASRTASVTMRCWVLSETIPTLCVLQKFLHAVSN